MMVRYSALARTVSLALCFLTISCKTTTGNYRNKTRVGTNESAGQSPIDNPVLESLPSETMDGASRNGDQKSAPDPGSEGATAKPDIFSVHFNRLFMGQEFACGIHDPKLSENNKVEVYCWGSNRAGQLGLGPEVQTRSFPYRVYTGMNVSSYGVGLTGACVAERTGEVTCWGGRMLTDEPSTGFGSVKIAQGLQRPSFMVAGSHRCAGVFQFVNVDNVLVPDASMQCWGSNSSGQFANGLTSAERTNAPVDIKLNVGWIHEMTEAGAGTCLLANADTNINSTKKPDKVYCWGNNANGSGVAGRLVPGTASELITTPTEVAGFTGELSQLKSSGQVSCVLVNGSDLTCWGENVGNLISETETAVSGTMLPPTLIKLPFKIKSYAVAAGNICVVSVTGDVYCWGSNQRGQMGTGRADNAIVKPSQAMKITLPRPALSVVVNLYGGCALFANERASCWGSNDSGIIGSGSALPGIYPPTPVYQDSEK